MRNFGVKFCPASNSRYNFGTVRRDRYVVAESRKRSWGAVSKRAQGRRKTKETKKFKLSNATMQNFIITSHSFSMLAG